MSWNSYPKQVCISLLKRLNSNINKTKEQTVDDPKKIWLNLLNTNCVQFAEYLKFCALPDIDAVHTIVSKKYTCTMLLLKILNY